MVKQMTCGLLLFFAVKALPAGFDCALARTLFEKTICSDPGLSRLDDTLSMMYREAIDSAADPIKVRNDQRVWLKQVRRANLEKKKIGQTYHGRIKALGMYPKYTWKTYQDTDYGFSFEYPSNRPVNPGEHAGQAVLSIPGEDPVKTVLEILVIEAGFDSANAREGTFEKMDGKWIGHGDRCSYQPSAEAIRGPGWNGQSVEFGCAGVSEIGSNCGGTCFEALVSNGTRSAYFFMSEPLGIFSRTLHSFRFLSSPDR
jgi:uncharacterized protein